MIYFTAHTFKCVCHCRRAMFRVLGMYNFGMSIQNMVMILDKDIPCALSRKKILCPKNWGA